MKARKSSPAPIKRQGIFIVDDHPITRYGLGQLINQQPDLVVSGEAPSAQEALSALSSAHSDLVVADITLPGKSGLDFIKDLQAQQPNLPVLVMSMHDESLYAERVLRAGARGYIMKNEGGEKLLEAIRRVLGGEVYVSPRTSAALLDALSRGHNATTGAKPAVLSDREFEVFQLIGQGLSTQQIGRRLNLSGKTVGTHRAHIKEKLKLRTSGELIKEAIQWAAIQHLV